MMKRRSFILAGSSAALLSACSGSAPSLAQNRFAQANLAASSASFNARFTLPGMVDAWGIAIRPAGAGGHFWVGGGSASWEFVGDVRQASDPGLRELGVDPLTRVDVPQAGPEGHVTGVAYNGAALTSANFDPSASASGARQTMPDGSATPVPMQGSARFIFVTDNGFISAWTERRQDNGAVMRHNGAAQQVFDGSARGHRYFGAAVRPDSWDTLWVADFGSAPQIRQFDACWRLVPTAGFANPFASGSNGMARPGDFVPFNIQAIDGRVFVTYARSRPDPSDASAFLAGEEDSLDAEEERNGGFVPDRGRLAEFDLNGHLVRLYQDEKHLNAPWGVAIAPASFGPFGGAVLVGNFGGGGHITAFDGRSGGFLGYLRNPEAGRVSIPGLWGLQFGNGASLGDSNALYFAAGPQDEAAGLFGSLRHAPG